MISRQDVREALSGGESTWWAVADALGARTRGERGRVRDMMRGMKNRGQLRLVGGTYYQLTEEGVRALVRCRD